MPDQESHNNDLDETKKNARPSPAGVTDADDSGTCKEYLVYDYKTYDLRICPVGPSEHEAIYFAEHSSWTPGKPDLILHRGADKSGPTLGVANFPLFGTDTVGIGDPVTDLNAMVWEELKCTSRWTHDDYEFEFPFLFAGRDDGGTRFKWRRTKTRVLHDQSDLELVRAGEEDVVLASYVGFGLLEGKKRATLRIRAGFGETWELMVLLTGLSLVELSRRRARARRYKAG